jgi:hypothetical protein
MRIVQKTKNAKRVAYKSLVRLILEYGAACWDPYRECQINTLDRFLNKAAKFAYHTGIFGAAYEDSTHVCALQSVYWKEGVQSYRG